MTEVTLRMHGLDCADEVAVLKRAVSPIVGGEDRLSFDLLHARMTVRLADATTVEDVIAAVARTGMRAEAWVDGASSDAASPWPRRARTAATIASGLLTASGFVAHAVMSGSIAAALVHANPRPSDVR